jgi:23S rRNA (uracil1939-C5)-methyltransferase
LLLTIEKLIYGGDGLTRLPADEQGPGKTVFIPFVLAGEKIQATLTQQKSSFARAKADVIVEASPHRVQPDCPYFTRCGGCHYQHADYAHQLEIKKDILRENLRRFAKLELPCEIAVHPSPPWNYRNRSRLQLRTKPDFAAGYFKLASHELLAVEECPISSPLINRGIATLWRMGRAGKVPQGIREVEFFANLEDSQLLLQVFCVAEARRAAARTWVEELQAALPEIAGVVALRETKPKAAVAPELLLSVGQQFLSYKTQHAGYRVSAGAFFQTNRHLTDELVKIVTEGQSGDVALDLYAGVGLFSKALADNFQRTVAVESSKLSASDLKHNLLPTNGRAEAVQSTTEQYLSQPSLPKPDLVVMDPPRPGLGDRVTRALSALGAAHLIYVSCDPATLARDLVPLAAAGYRVEQAHLIDLFPQTYHLENVLHLTC